jgi:hypothetical protein
MKKFFFAERAVVQAVPDLVSARRSARRDPDVSAMPTFPAP